LACILSKVPIDAEWLQKGGCLVLRANDIFVHCGETALFLEVNKASELANRLLNEDDSRKEARVHSFIPGAGVETIYENEM
jgi:hypothetical protein